MPARSDKMTRGEQDRIWRRTLSPLRRACLSLGLRVDAHPKTNLARALRKARLGKTAIDYLRLSSDEQAQRIVALYSTLNSTERKAVTIDYLVMAAAVDVHHISGVIQEERSRLGGMELLASMDSPAVVEKAIERALTDEGSKDRELIFRIVGLLPASPSAFQTLHSSRRRLNPRAALPLDLPPY